MIPTLILKLEIVLWKNICQTAESCFTDKVLPKRKKERKKKKENEVTLDGFNSQKWENQILKITRFL
jgi:hypothetical protein